MICILFLLFLMETIILYTEKNSRNRYHGAYFEQRNYIIVKFVIHNSINREWIQET